MAIKILLVDPYDDEREMFSDYLRARDFEVVALSSDANAVRAAAEWRPDVIVVRAAVALANVFATIRILRSSTETGSTRIVVLTTDVFADPNPALAVGATEVVQLPVAPDALASALRDGINHPLRA